MSGGSRRRSSGGSGSSEPRRTATTRRLPWQGAGRSPSGGSSCGRSPAGCDAGCRGCRPGAASVRWPTAPRARCGIHQRLLFHFGDTLTDRHLQLTKLPCLSCDNCMLITWRLHGGPLCGAPRCTFSKLCPSSCFATFHKACLRLRRFGLPHRQNSPCYLHMLHTITMKCIASARWSKAQKVAHSRARAVPGGASATSTHTVCHAVPVATARVQQPGSAECSSSSRTTGKLQSTRCRFSGGSPSAAAPAAAAASSSKPCFSCFSSFTSAASPCNAPASTAAAAAARSSAISRCSASSDSTPGPPSGPPAGAPSAVTSTMAPGSRPYL